MTIDERQRMCRTVAAKSDCIRLVSFSEEEMEDKPSSWYFSPDGNVTILAMCTLLSVSLNAVSLISSSRNRASSCQSLEGSINIPACIITTGYPTNPRPNLHSRRVDPETKSSQHMIEKNAILHTITSSSPLVAHNLLKQNLGI